MAGSRTPGVRALTLALLAGLAGCDRPGPLSAAARVNPPPTPAAPAWAAPLQGQSLRATFPTEARCLSAVDAATERYKGGRKLVGWAWDQARARPVERLAVVDAAGRMVGFGEGGIARPDVPAARPEVGSPTTGWWAISPTVERRYTIWGLDEATGSACVVGEAKP